MIEVRRIHAEEGPLLRALRIDALTDSPSAFASTLERELAFDDGLWASRAEGSARGHERLMVVAIDGDHPVGLAGGITDAFLAGVETTGRPVVQLVSMWVRPSHRGRGLAQRLVQAVLIWAGEARARRIELGVAVGNEAASALYRRCGFEETGVVQPLASDPERGEIRMALGMEPGAGSGRGGARVGQPGLDPDPVVGDP